MQVSTFKLEKSLSGYEEIFLKCNTHSRDLAICAATAALPMAGRLNNAGDALSGEETTIKKSKSTFYLN